MLQGACNPSAIEAGATVVSQMVGGARTAGLADGAADILASSIGSVFEQGEGRVDDEADAVGADAGAAVGRRLSAQGVAAESSFTNGVRHATADA